MIDIERLHAIHNGTIGRASGQTTYACMSVIGYCQVLENTMIPVILPSFMKINEFIDHLHWLSCELGEELMINKLSYVECAVGSNGNTLRFLKQPLDKVQQRAIHRIQTKEYICECCGSTEVVKYLINPIFDNSSND